jgi:hypothetical protein
MTVARTKAAHAVALRAILDSAAYLNAPTSSRRTQDERSRAKNEGLTGPAPSGMTCALGRIRTCNLLIRRSGSHARRVALAWSGRPLRCLSCLGWWWTTSFRTHRDPHRTVAGRAASGSRTPDLRITRGTSDHSLSPTSTQATPYNTEARAGRSLTYRRCRTRIASRR